MGCLFAKNYRKKTVRGLSALIAVIWMCAAFSLAYGAQEVLRDKDITQAVELNLLADMSVSTHLIDVETHEGVVTLSGSVDNFMEKDRVINIVESVKGVRSIIDMIEVKPVFRTDREIQKDVRSALMLDPAADSYEVKARVKDGVVTLTGTVESQAEKELCGDIAEGIRGVKDLENEIRIQNKTARPDSEIMPEIERRLSMDPFIDKELIDVTVKDGTVKLGGVVGSLAGKSHAYRDAWVMGVKSVHDSGLEVEWWMADKGRRESTLPDKTDAGIKKAVEDSFLYDPRTVPFEIDVYVDNGAVILTGTVDNLKARNAAGEDARDTIGVWKVNNFLKVRPQTSPDDKKIALNIRSALLRDPALNRFDISASVLNQKAYLYGVVDTYFEKYHAEDVTSRVPGVVDVANNVTVLDTWTWKPDREIKEDIENKLFWNTLVKSDDISVSVEDGVATIKGKVDTLKEYREAIEDAFEGGARAVKSRLKIDDYGLRYEGYSYSPMTWWKSWQE